MNPSPTGKLYSSPADRTLELSRIFQAPIADVWASLTESDLTGKWIGTWSGDAGVGKTIDYTMTAEGVTEPSPVTITACEPPRVLGLDMQGPGSIWQVRVELSEADGQTTARFHHYLGPDDDICDIGPGWEYYFDSWLAAHFGETMPAWDDYYPSQRDYYCALQPETR